MRVLARYFLLFSFFVYLKYFKWRKRPYILNILTIPHLIKWLNLLFIQWLIPVPTNFNSHNYQFWKRIILQKHILLMQNRSKTTTKVIEQVLVAELITAIEIEWLTQLLVQCERCWQVTNELIRNYKVHQSIPMCILCALPALNWLMTQLCVTVF